jgi:hypothetical protein
VNTASATKAAAAIAFEIVTQWGLTVTVKLNNGGTMTGRLSASRPNVSGTPRAE